jgi:Domain of unknown function DUF29
VAVVVATAYPAGVSDAADLYERDFHAWTQDQAATLRAWPERLRPNALDIGHLAEEIEDLGIAQRNAVQSLCYQLLLHLLKLGHHPDQTPRSHWQSEVDEFRASLERAFEQSPSLKARRHELVGGEWDRAARRFALVLRRDGHQPESLSISLPATGRPYFDLDAEVLNADWFPAPPAG